DVIEVAVRNQDCIHALDLVLRGIRRVAFGPGIHEEDFASAQAKLKRAVPQPGDFEHPFPILQEDGKCKCPDCSGYLDDTWINLPDLVIVFAVNAMLVVRT